MWNCGYAFCAGCILFHHQECGRAKCIPPFPPLAVRTCRVCSSTLKTACKGMVYPSLPPSCSVDVSVYPFPQSTASVDMSMNSFPAVSACRVYLSCPPAVCNVACRVYLSCPPAVCNVACRVYLSCPPAVCNVACRVYHSLPKRMDRIEGT